MLLPVNSQDSAQSTGDFNHRYEGDKRSHSGLDVSNDLLHSSVDLILRYEEAFPLRVSVVRETDRWPFF